MFLRDLEKLHGGNVQKDMNGKQLQTNALKGEVVLNVQLINEVVTMEKTIRWPYYIWMYFDILKKLNSNYRKLNNLDGKNNNRKREELYYEIFEER